MPVVVTIAVGGGSVATTATVLLVRSAGRPSAVARAGPAPATHPGTSAAHRSLALGAAATTLSTVAGLATLAGLGADWSDHRHQRMLLASAVALGFAAGGAGLWAGLLRLPGVIRGPAAATRLALDGVIVAAALWFVGWVLLSRPTRLLGSATPMGCPAILVATVTAAGGAGLAAIVILRASRPRTRSVLAGAGVTGTALAGLLLAAGICQSGPAVTVAGAALAPTALLLLALAARTAEAVDEAGPDVMLRGTGYAILPMTGIALAACYQQVVGGEFGPLPLAAGIIEGFALVFRHSLALRQVRGYANRLVEREAHFRELAHTDPLTGLANRRGLLRALHEAPPGAPAVLLGLDLDGFKVVNDMRGHDVGDAVLVEVAQRLRRNLRPADVAARLGGDEFAVLLRGDLPEAQRVAERLLAVLGEAYQAAKGPVHLSVSIGLALRPAAGGVEALLRHADLALRYAKQRGKNRIERYDASHSDRLRRRATLEHELRGAIGRDELWLAFQPVVAVPSVRPVGAEALLRWESPRLGVVGPDEFIPLAEECGMIAELGAWVLHRACHQLSRWLADGHDVWVSVNVSPRELHSAEYVRQVAEALRKHGVPAQRLVLEVTEHAVATDLDELIRRLAALRRTGVRIALDDFGAGYSSLGQLRRLPIDILKIDHSLVTDPDPEPDGGVRSVAAVGMVDLVMRLGHRLGLEVIAEGVTTPGELAAVVGAGCRFGQGLLFGWGVPAEHLEARLEAAAGPPGAGPPVPMPPVPPQRSGGPARVVGPTPAVQDVRSVDSAREMRQA
ncbi:putative bifunctional diguanylate cyclase/phosphodiesterase [Plantactinospora siamensis]|uniref:Bifunctional diguanylate cyclase/phosphodiesterase n=1 Tax=Plantactinospora siamensis TaxID=555372 RepID=A0ABV6NT79_9ACTN